MSKRDKSKKLGLVEVLVLASAILFVLATFIPATRKLRFYAFCTRCNNNLSLIGKAIQTYANDYDGKLPRSGGRNSV
ncbi:MAG: type II secretion system protein, partial [Planctomycetota bacterium]